ncbi:MAG: RES family NAD+ phosphorylase, partial [Alphaproteobacteria bacterium]
MSGSGHIHDRELLDALEAIDPEKYEGKTWRTTWTSRDPLVGNKAGGRWNPPDSFEALYTSLEADGSLSETYYHLSKAPIFPSATVKLFRLNVVTEKTLRLDEDALINLGIDKARFQQMDYVRSQEIGSAAHMLEFDSLLV